ncbi:MAG: hypothetical protein ABIR24_04305, partial [Verrucomicrobiota bacterium]
DSALATVSITIVSVNDAPIAVARAFPAFLFSTNDTSTVVISANGTNAIVVLDASLSSDIENDSLQYLWLEGTNVLASEEIASITFDVGTHIITLNVSDSSDTGFDNLTLEVITPAQAIAELISFLNESNLVDKRQRALFASLNASAASFSRGQFGAGIKQLETFQTQVRVLIEPTNPALAEQLLHISGEILDAVSTD